MPANFLHGVETIEIKKGARPIRTVKTAVIGLVGTAPVNTVGADYKTINKPVLITSDKDAALYFGQPTNGFTIPSALNAIFDQGAGIVIVVNVFDPAVHEDVSDVQLSDIIGGVDAQGKRTGMQCFKDAYSLFGFYPKTLIVPKYCEDMAVATEMNAIAANIRAVGIIDAPVGTSVQGAITGRGASGTINFNFSSDRLVLCYPHLKVYDTATDTERLEPYSQRLAGVIAAKDIEKGYHWSPSNTEIKGIIGVERNLTSMINDPASEVNLLNEAGILTVFNSFGSGFRTWGNRNASYPSSTDPTNFINIRRTADIIHESVEYSMLQFIDYPIDNGLIDSICESVNAFIRTLIGRGALIDGKCKFNPAKNPPTEIANGHLTFDIEFMPPTPAERITFESFINIELLRSLIQ
ncbi:MAG TPA: phage tail sheath subtilisin-like domain-containing protein [Candidatus Gastranaerophilales bacterium]|nr:phage tail sheath subtilisin-like domain-containing protein [Candidatus Gastranaerophilales bacterium]